MAERIGKDGKALPRLSRLQRRVVMQCADFYGYTEEDLRGDGRTASIVHARQMCCYLLREHGCSFPEAGRAIHRDHTTVIAAVRRIRSRLLVSEPLRRELEDLRAFVSQPNRKLHRCDQPEARWCA